MPVFKPSLNAQTMTLDSRHNEFLRKFKEDEEVTIPNFHAQIDRLKTKENSADQIRSIEAAVQKLEEERLNYLLKNSKHIYGYFDEKKKISEGVGNVTV